MLFYKHDKYNRSTFFVLPAIDFPKVHFIDLINTYLFCPEIADDDEYRIFLHIKLSDKLLKILQLYNTVTIVKYLKNNEAIVTCIIDHVYRDDINKFIDGQYSKFSEGYKTRIKKYYSMYAINPVDNKKFITTATYRILEPTDEERQMWADALYARVPKDAEIYSIPNIDEETFILPKV